MVEKVSPAELEEIVNTSSIPVLVDFNIKFCMPCKRLEPVFAEAAEEVGDKARFLSANADDAYVIASSLGISSFPTMVLFVGGREVKRFIGPKPKDVIVGLFE